MIRKFVRSALFFAGCLSFMVTVLVLAPTGWKQKFHELVMRPKAEQVHQLYETALNLNGEQSTSLRKAVEVIILQDTINMVYTFGLTSFASGLGFIAVFLATTKSPYPSNPS